MELIESVKSYIKMCLVGVDLEINEIRLASDPRLKILYAKKTAYQEIMTAIEAIIILENNKQ